MRSRNKRASGGWWETNPAWQFAVHRVVKVISQQTAAAGLTEEHFSLFSETKHRPPPQFPPHGGSSHECLSLKDLVQSWSQGRVMTSQRVTTWCLCLFHGDRTGSLWRGVTTWCRRADPVTHKLKLKLTHIWVCICVLINNLVSVQQLTGTRVTRVTRGYQGLPGVMGSDGGLQAVWW